MAVVISSTVYNQMDQMGNHRTELWALVEFRAALYAPGGENLALASLLNRVESMQVTTASGALLYAAEPNLADYPGNAGSGRLKLIMPISGAISEIISGAAVSGVRAMIHALGA